MLNRKIGFSILSIAAAFVVMGGAAYAAFSSVASSNGNIFSAGTLNLLLDDNNESTPATTVTASIGGTNMIPGGTPTSGFISLHNEGTIDISSIDLATSASVNQGPDNNGDIRNAINLTVKTGLDNACSTGDTDFTGTLATNFGNGLSPLTLGELNGNTFTGLPGLVALGADKFLCVTAQLDSSAGNDLQGDSSNVTFTLTGHQ